MNLVQEYYNSYDEAGRLSRDNMHKIEYFTKFPKKEIRYRKDLLK